MLDSGFPAAQNTVVSNPIRAPLTKENSMSARKLCLLLGIVCLVWLWAGPSAAQDRILYYKEKVGQDVLLASGMIVEESKVRVVVQAAGLKRDIPSETVVEVTYAIPV